MHLLVNFSRESVQNRLVAGLYKEKLFEELLYEDEGLTNERKRVKALLDAYREAFNGKFIGTADTGPGYDFLTDGLVFAFTSAVRGDFQTVSMMIELFYRSLSPCRLSFTFVL